MSDNPQIHSTSTGPTPLRFVQVVELDSRAGIRDEFSPEPRLVGLTHQGDLYVRYYSETVDGWIWYPAPSFSSTDLVDNLVCPDCGREFIRGFAHDHCPKCHTGRLQPKV